MCVNQSLVGFLLVRNDCWLLMCLSLIALPVLHGPMCCVSESFEGERIASSFCVVAAALFSAQEWIKCQSEMLANGIGMSPFRAIIF